MAVQLKDVKNIRLRATFKPDEIISRKSPFDNYFRTFKPAEEYVEDNHFCSPFFSRGDIIQMHEHYGDRVNPKETIANSLCKVNCLSVYLAYDFRFAAVNEKYFTAGEFRYIKSKIEKSLKDTGLYLAFMVSHFNQLVGKPLYMKPEHYHLLICRERDMDDFEYDVAVNRFAENLQKDGLISVEFE